MKTILCIINLIFLREFNLINAPFQFMCLNEYMTKINSVKKKNNVVFVGYCSTSSKNQIKSMNSQIFDLRYKIFFLGELFHIRIFHIIFFIIKNIKRNFLNCVCGSYKYYLFKEFVKKSNSNVFLDEGFDLVYEKNLLDISKYNGSIFSCFDLKVKNLHYIKNSFSFLKDKNYDKKKIDQNIIFCLGTTFFESEHRLGGIENHLKNIVKKYKNKKIFYFPHRNEKLKNKIFNQFVIKTIDVPIEIYLLKTKILPGTICAFYSTALFTIKKILEKNDIKLININFDLNKYNWDDSPDVSKHLDFEKILKKNDITNFY